MNAHAPQHYLDFIRGSSNYVLAAANKRTVFAQMIAEKYFKEVRFAHTLLLTSYALLLMHNS
jgi:hypothetical protein